jgi:hypothetical protein
MVVIVERKRTRGCGSVPAFLDLERKQKKTKNG